MPTTDQIGLYKNIAAESGGFIVAEGASMAVSLGVVGIADKVFPNQLKDASKVVSKLCVEPFLDTIEYGLGTVCKLKECQPDKTKPREERAQELAKTMIVFSAAWGLSMLGKVLTRRAYNSAFLGQEAEREAGKFLSSHEKRIFLADEGVHYGSILLMNTIGANVTDGMISSLTSFFQKCGMSERKAKEMSSMAIIWELPNALGMAAGVGAIARDHLKGRVSGSAGYAASLMAERQAASLLDPKLGKN